MESVCTRLLGEFPCCCSISALLMYSQACCGGMLFGMDSGIIGGVLTMPAFEQ